PTIIPLTLPSWMSSTEPASTIPSQTKPEAASSSPLTIRRPRPLQPLPGLEYPGTPPTGEQAAGAGPRDRAGDARRHRRRPRSGARRIGREVVAIDATARVLRVDLLRGHH